MIWRNRVGVRAKVIFMLLVLVCTTAIASAQIAGTEESSDIQAAIDTLNQNIIELLFLTQTIETVLEMERILTEGFKKISKLAADKSFVDAS